MEVGKASETSVIIAEYLFFATESYRAGEEVKFPRPIAKTAKTIARISKIKKSRRRGIKRGVRENHCSYGEGWWYYSVCFNGSRQVNFYNRLFVYHVQNHSPGNFGHPPMSKISRAAMLKPFVEYKITPAKSDIQCLTLPGLFTV